MDYQKLGLKAGLEIHQQLEGRKLFCSCPTILRDDEPHFTVERKIRASAGEEGEVDVAAAQEQARDKLFVYQGYHDSTCLVEIDEEPPHAIDPNSLTKSLQFCKMVQSHISPVIQVMRKTVVDGSNTSGFQRTALIGRGGAIDTSAGPVRIANISLEEDAGKIVSETGEVKTYKLDRLGIPLIEIGTAPDIKTPQQCQEAAKKIGMLLRSIPDIKRGLGTIRQDVNVSIRDGARIEIKGAQDIKMVPLLVELEAKRQLELLKIKKEFYGYRLNEFKIVDLSVILKDCKSKIVTKTQENEGKILGIKLHGFAGLVGRELQPKNRLGTEFSGRAKIIAQVGGIIHSDELPNYGLSENEIRIIRQKLLCTPKDAFIIVADKENKARLALWAVYQRAQELFLGVPKEVRKANNDGTSSYMRPMPGAARMYPETDVPLTIPKTEDIKIPELIEDKINRFQKDYSLSFDLASFIAKSDNNFLFEEFVGKYPKLKSAFIADVLTSILVEIRRKYQLDTSSLTQDDFRKVFEYLSANKIHKDIVLDVLIEMIKGSFDIAKYESLSTENIHEVLKKIIAKNKDAPMGALMGQAMKELAGKASGKVIMQELKKLMGHTKV